MIQGNALRLPLADESVHCVVTSPPYYGLRDYGTAAWEGGDEGCDHVAGEIRTGLGLAKLGERYRGGGNKQGQVETLQYRNTCPKCGAVRIDAQLGLEPTLAEYVANMVEVFREVRRVLHPSGQLFLNISDTRSKDRQWLGIPQRLVLALQADGWRWEDEIVWSKKNPMPGSQTNRFTRSHEMVYMLNKSKAAFFDLDAVKEAPQRTTKVGWKDADLQRYSCDDRLEKQGSYKNWRKYCPTGVVSSRNRRSVWQIATEPFSGWLQTSRLVLVAPDDVSDGMKRKASLDCPVHAHQDRRGDERVSGGQSRTTCNDGRHAQGQGDAPASSSRHRGGSNLESRSDSQGRSYDRSATDHSSQTHKTGRAPLTSSAYTPSDETPSRIGDTSVLSASAEPRERRRDRNTSPDGTGAHSQDQIHYHTVDKSSLPISPSCTCEFYQKITEKKSHFATFPQALVEPCIKAGSSERGVCAECGSPWERVTEKVEKPGDYPMYDGAGRKGNIPGDNGVNATRKPVAGGSSIARYDNNTTGWRPTCYCCKTCGGTLIDTERMTATEYKDCHDCEPVPATVLDPFFGSGTVGLVARNLGRNFAGVDLSFEYLQLARERLGLTALDAWNSGEGIAAGDDLGGLPLFGPT